MSAYPDLSVVIAPAALLTTADVKLHLRIDSTDDDAVIAGMIAAAVSDLDAPLGWLNRALGEQTLCLTAGHFPGCGWNYDWCRGYRHLVSHHVDEIRLPWPPVQSVTSVVYLDPTGAPQTLDPSLYALDDRILFPLGGANWPATALRPGAVKVTYVAGYGADAPDLDKRTLPAPIRSALLLRIGALYMARDDSAAIPSLTSERLLAPWRVFA